MAEKPVLTLENCVEYPTNYEKYYNDHLPFRNQLIKLNNTMEYFVFRQSSDKVVVGDDGWLFYCNNEDGNPVEQSLGYSSYSNEELKEIAENLQLCKKVLNF